MNVLVVRSKIQVNTPSELPWIDKKNIDTTNPDGNVDPARKTVIQTMARAVVPKFGNYFLETFCGTICAKHF